MQKIQSDFSSKENKNKSIIKNKFIFIIIVLIVSIVIGVIYTWFLKPGVDRNSYVSLVEWEWYLNESNLVLWDKESLSVWDVIKTTKENSLAIIEWWDWSVTRLWWNTEIQVNELFVSQSKDRLNIAFSLFSWKTWSNVLSYIPWDSYFKQSFMDMEAAVRWTVYNVDLDNNYLYVIDHSVELIDSFWKTYSINEKEPFDIKNFNFIKLEEFISSYKDSLFEQVNRKLDSELIKLLKNNINEKLTQISELATVEIWEIDPAKKEELYNNVLSTYQDLNKFSSEDGILFEIKMDLKEKLYLLSDWTEKDLVAQSFVYDVKDVTDSNNYEYLNDILSKLNENNINVNDSIKNYVENINYDNISPELRNSLQNNYETLVNTLNIDTESIINNANEVKDNFKQSFGGSIMNLFKNLFN